MALAVAPIQIHQQSASVEKAMPSTRLTEIGNKKTELPKGARLSGSAHDWLAVIPAQVLSDSALSASAKVVFGAVSSFSANGTKEAFPSHSQIDLTPKM